MVNHLKVVVYVPASEAISLREEGKDPSEWVRGLVRRAFEKRKESREPDRLVRAADAG